IRHSQSERGASIAFAKKVDRCLCPCLKFQGLNPVTKRDLKLLPSLLGMRDQSAYAKYLTLVNFKDAHRSVLVAADSTMKTAIRTR
ncbi:hypothetical protein BJ085DRAFT_22393, partial [Dimargaris cristalligena]